MNANNVSDERIRCKYDLDDKTPIIRNMRKVGADRYVGQHGGGTVKCIEGDWYLRSGVMKMTLVFVASAS